MKIKTEIICKTFKHKKPVNGKLIVDEGSEEYYIIPITKQFKAETDGEVYKLLFENQILWLKYSNHKHEILLKEFDFKEFIIIKSDEILDINVFVKTNKMFRKNIWQSKTSVKINKQYDNQYFIIIPIMEDMIKIHEYGEGIRWYEINVISNEILLKKAHISGENNCLLNLTVNATLNKEALFLPLYDKDVASFIES